MLVSLQNGALPGLTDAGRLYLRNKWGMPVWSFSDWKQAGDGRWPEVSSDGQQGTWETVTRLYWGNMILSPDGKVRILHQEDHNLCAYLAKWGKVYNNADGLIWCAYASVPPDVAYYEFTPRQTLQVHAWDDLEDGGVKLLREIDFQNLSDGALWGSNPASKW